MLKRLKNGIRFLSETKSNSNYIVIDFCYNVGFVNEDSSTLGFTHILEHLFLRSTKLNNYKDLIIKLENLGTNINAYTKKEFTHFYIESTRQNFKQSCEIFFDLINNIYLDIQELNNNVKIVNQEILMYKNDINDIVKDGLNKKMFNNSYSNAITDNMLDENLDCHKLIEFKNKYFNNSSLIVSCIGDINEDVKKYLENKLNQLANYASHKKIIETDFANNIDMIVDNGTLVSLGKQFACKSSSIRDIIILKLISKLLGGCVSSRLSQTLKQDNSLVYLTYSYADYYKTFNTLTILTTCSKENYNKVVKLQNEILTKIKNCLISNNELNKAKELLKLNYIKMFNDLQKSSDFITEVFSIYDVKINLEDLISIIDSITLIDANQLIEKLL